MKNRDSLLERSRQGAEQREPLKRETGHCAEGELEMPFSPAMRKKAVREE